MINHHETAVIEAARTVFRAHDMRDRTDRLATLKAAVDAYELHVTAEAMYGPTTRDRFAEALGRLPGQSGTRAMRLLVERFNGDPGLLAQVSWSDVRSINGAGHQVIAAWCAALVHIGMPPRWADAAVAGLSDDAYVSRLLANSAVLRGQ